MVSSRSPRGSGTRRDTATAFLRAAARSGDRAARGLGARAATCDMHCMRFVQRDRIMEASSRLSCRSASSSSMAVTPTVCAAASAGGWSAASGPFVAPRRPLAILPPTLPLPAARATMALGPAASLASARCAWSAVFFFFFTLGAPLRVPAAVASGGAAAPSSFAFRFFSPVGDLALRRPSSSSPSSLLGSVEHMSLCASKEVCSTGRWHTWHSTTSRPLALRSRLAAREGWRPASSAAIRASASGTYNMRGRSRARSPTSAHEATMPVVVCATAPMGV
mmetsp:Transcript_27546/g.92102  ORF Transcript_27546/g.92102 Transcript_27546/m.92102 type:complete len:279 (+) Transcript_27546:293-1129(+)